MLGKLTPYETVNKNFFFIDSSDESLNSVKSHLYGFYLEDGKIFDGKIEGTKFPREETVDGSFVFIERVGNKITIKHDYSGTYGIFLFRHGDYWAISNSFIMLVDNIKTKFSLTLNEDYANTFFITDLTSWSFNETMIKEIELLPRSYEIIIDTKTKKLDLSLINYEEYTVPLDSPEGIEIIDDWVIKWIDLINNLSSVTENGGGAIQIDISGGMDSRSAFVPFLSSNVDLNKVKIRCRNNGYLNENLKKIVLEDFDIASQIARFYNFSLNKDAVHVETRPFTQEEIISNSFYTKLGFHNVMYGETEYNIQPIYHINGYSGENVKGKYYKSPNSFIRGLVSAAGIYKTVRLEESALKIMQTSCQKINKIFNIVGDDNPLTTVFLYKETLNRSHFGLSIVEGYTANRIKLAPMMSHDLNRINIFESNLDPKLLFVLLLVRYQKDLLNFKFEGNRSYKRETVQLAESINVKYPKKKGLNINNRISSIPNDIQILETKDTDILPRKIEDHILSMTRTENFKNKFTSYFPEEIYQKAQLTAEKNKSGCPLLRLYSLIAATKALTDVNISHYMTKDIAKQCLEVENTVSSIQKVESQSNKIAMILNSFQTAKIYILKNNMLNIEDFNIAISDERGKIIPLLNAERNRIIGYSLESSKQNIHIKFKCKTDGDVSILLGCEELIDIKNNTIPMSIDYTYLSVNKKEFLANGRIIVKSNDPYNVKLEAKQDEIYEIIISWKVHGYSDKEFLKVIANIIENDFVYNT